MFFHISEKRIVVFFTHAKNLVGVMSFYICKKDLIEAMCFYDKQKL